MTYVPDELNVPPLIWTEFEAHSLCFCVIYAWFAPCSQEAVVGRTSPSSSSSIGLWLQNQRASQPAVRHRVPPLALIMGISAGFLVLLLVLPFAMEPLSIHLEREFEKEWHIGGVCELKNCWQRVGERVKHTCECVFVCLCVYVCGFLNKIPTYLNH